MCTFYIVYYKFGREKKFFAPKIMYNFSFFHFFIFHFFCRKPKHIGCCIYLSSIRIKPCGGAPKFDKKCIDVEVPQASFG